MQASPYTSAISALSAKTDNQQAADGNAPPPHPEEEPEKVVYVYPLEGGGVVWTGTPVEEDGPPPDAPIVDAKEPEVSTRPAARREPAYFLHFLLMLFVFIGLDSLDAALAPTVTITITPVVKTISTTVTVSAGADAEIEGRALPPLILSQEQTVRATGRGHQDAQAATGTLIYFNGAFALQTVDAGTVYTGADGVQVTTDATVTIPAATPGSPPQFGQATVVAHAIRAGAGGNIRAGDIAVTGSALQVGNGQFQGGQDARSFTYVTKADVERPAALLKAQVAQSMQAALGQQLASGEQLQKTLCAPAVAADPAIGQEASNLRVTVSETCSGFAYNSRELTARAAKLLTAQATRTLGSGYAPLGNIAVYVVKAATQGQTAVLTFTCRGTWMYRIDKARIEALVSGKPRLAALQLLGRFPGVARASIGGVTGDQELPTDLAHIHVLILFPAV